MTRITITLPGGTPRMETPAMATVSIDGVQDITTQEATIAITMAAGQPHAWLWRVSDGKHIRHRIRNCVITADYDPEEISGPIPAPEITQETFEQRIRHMMRTDPQLFENYARTMARRHGQRTITD